MYTVEPVSIENTKPVLSVSLRGSLADNYHRLVHQQTKQDADHFIEELLASNDADLLRFKEGEHVVIGLQSEMGRYFPDW